MRWLLCAALAALVGSSAWARTPVQRERSESLDTGRESGYCTTVAITPQAYDYVNFGTSEESILALDRKTAQVWRQHRSQLGMPFASHPAWGFRARKRQGWLVRFEGGIIRIPSQGKAVFMSWPSAKQWWQRGNVRRLVS